MGRVAGPIIVHFYETLLGNVLFIQEYFLLKFDKQHLSYVGHKTLFSANIIVMWKIWNQGFFFPQICDIKKKKAVFSKKIANLHNFFF